MEQLVGGCNSLRVRAVGCGWIWVDGSGFMVLVWCVWHVVCVLVGKGR